MTVFNKVVDSGLQDPVHSWEASVSIACAALQGSAQHPPCRPRLWDGTVEALQEEGLSPDPNPEARNSLRAGG